MDRVKRTKGKRTKVRAKRRIRVGDELNSDEEEEFDSSNADVCEDGVNIEIPVQKKTLGKILSLNIRSFGSGKDSKIGNFRKLLFCERPEVVMIQETKFNTVDRRWVSFLWNSDDFNFIQKEKIGKSGGKMEGRDDDFVIVNVYGPHDDTNNLKMWASLEKFVGEYDMAWLLGGDFNEVRDPLERKKFIFMERRASWFNDFINNSRLIDVPLGGKHLTIICDNAIKFSKLDRFLVSEKFNHMWGCLSALALERKLSDHCRDILRDKEIDFGPKLTKIFDEWLEAEGTEESVKTSGKLDEEISELKNVATKWELIVGSRSLSDTERDTWLDSRKRWIEKEKIKTNIAKQKSRVKWSLEGDENTKYFQSIMKRRYSKCTICGLNINGTKTR
ncbi:uncharacterized protein [Rutidosis leptorrhynchoides]|uniref:uncharacterized protein n=1 Tax=Rutidosis leptorrhynchoides TaxID=125765 RepID=UPI003A98E0BF